VSALLLGGGSSAGAEPAWWRVGDGRHEVWVLGAPQVTPKALFWDTSGVERRLTGASRLIVAAQPRGGLAAVVGLIGASASPRPMEAALPGPLRRRFDAVSAGIGRDPKRYDGWKPAVAGVMLSGDVYRAADLKQGEVESIVRKLAKKAGVPEAPAGVYDAGRLAAAAAALSPAGQLICLSATLRRLEVGAARMKADAAAWAAGTPKAAPPDAADEACIAAAPGMARLRAQGLAGEAQAIAAALKAPGRSIAVLDLQGLTAPAGVFDRLRASGLSVQGPQP